MLTSGQDPTLDITQDNYHEPVGFLSTNAGDIPLNVEQSTTGESVAGHVLFNQLGNCICRGRGNILGSSRQKHYVQSLCSTIEGESTQLLYPEAAVFTRRFYPTSRVDGQSILGARPLFCLTRKLYPHGFESALIHIRMRITDASSSTSTGTKYLSWAFDELANLTLNGVHSREAYRRGFVVDNTSGCGMTVRERGSDLNESVDSHIMVRNLAMSQKYVKWTLFFTDTCNQRDRPGVKNVTAWLASKKWTEWIPGYYSLSPFDQQEFKRAMQAASGPHLYHQWQLTKKMLLCHIRDHNTVIGKTTAIFGRDEYQGTTGNLCHNHMTMSLLTTRKITHTPIKQTTKKVYET